jgi:hypothetical protein
LNIAEKYIATEEGLAFSKRIADALGVEFDREGTRAEADQMYDLYFEAIVRIARLDPALIRFRSAAYRSLNAYVPTTHAVQGTIFFDELLDPWLLTSTTLLTIMACKPLEANEVAALVAAFEANLKVATRHLLHEANRKRLGGFMCRHADCMPVAVPLRRAMVVFILCHEIGHILANHHRQRRLSEPSLEQEADAKAVEVYTAICRAGLDAHPVSIDSKLAGAPILMMGLFRILERYLSVVGILDSGPRTHPPAAERAEYLREALRPVLSNGYYVLDGFSAALNEIDALLDLSEA